MKNTIYIFLAISILSLTACKSTEIYSEDGDIKKKPFKIIDATFEKTGEDQYVFSMVVSDNQAIFENIYFKDLEGQLIMDKNHADKKSFIANLNKNSIIEDLVLHSDPNKEFGNKPPKQIPKKYLKHLEGNNAVISFYLEGMRY